MSITKERIGEEIDNYILYFTSDDGEREQMRVVLTDYLNEVLE